MEEHGKDVLDVQTEAADEVSSAFPEGQTVVGVVVEEALGFHSAGFAVGAVEEVEEVMYFLDSGGKSVASTLELILEVVLEVVDIEVGIVGLKVAVTGVAWVET